MNQFRVITDHPIAYESLDHTNPHGTKNDNSRNARFNQKLYAFIRQRPLRVLDLGCAGGGFVKNCMDDGHIAVGLEGSDYSRIHRRVEWATIPDNLFCCDVTKPFGITYGGDAHDARFDLITAWEVMEHIPAEGLHQLCENVRWHLAPSGWWMMSISTTAELHHVTVKNRAWWLELFAAEGWQHNQDAVGYFGDDWIRGPLQNAPDSFHLVLQRKVA